MYKIQSFGKQLGIGVGGSRYAYLSAVAKDNVPSAAPYCIPNELICAELGRFIRLPIPPSSVVTMGTAPFYASLDFNLTGNSLPPVYVPDCMRIFPQLSAGLLLFDIWIANCDRNPRNFSADVIGQQMNVFDHGHALFGYALGQGLNRLSALRDRLGISWTTNHSIDSGRHRHCILDAIDSDLYFPFWSERIRAAPDFFIEDICSDALPYGMTVDERNAAVDFLKYRRDHLEQIIRGHRSEFTSITTWSYWS